MANDDKVKSEELIQISKDRFLPSEIRDQEPKHAEYSLAKEFAKSAHGFDWKFYSILIIFLGLIIGGTFAVTTYIDKKNQEAQFTFDIDDINNLQEQINSTNREEKNVNLAKSELSEVVRERDSKIASVEAVYAAKIEELGKKGLTPEELKAQKSQLVSGKNEEINKITKEYESSINEKEANVAKAEADYQKKKAKLEADINKAEKIVSNYKRLQQMQIDALNQKHANEMENLRLKYNPYFTEANVKGILRSVDKKKVMDSPITEDISSLYRNKVVTEAEIKAIRQKIADYKIILGKLQAIPYVNSVAPSIDIIQNDAYFLITEYERITKKLIRNLEVLQKYERAFNQITEFSVDSGIIIDASNSEDVIFSVKPVVKIQGGDSGIIFREADQFIGTLAFEDRYGKIIARVIETAPGAKIQPLDKIFIKGKKVEVTPAPSPENTENKSDDAVPVEPASGDSQSEGVDANTQNEVVP